MVKIPKTIKRLCPYCKKHTEHKVTEAKRKGLSSVHTQSRDSKVRMRKRGQRRGFGNYGKTSRPAINSRKMYNKKQSKKIDLRYQCKECKKTQGPKAGFRAKRVEFV